MSSHGGTAEPFGCDSLRAAGCAGAAAADARAPDADSGCATPRGAPGVGTGTTTRGAVGFGAAALALANAAGFGVDAAFARPRSDDTLRPALRRTSSAALAPPARRGGASGNVTGAAWAASFESAEDAASLARAKAAAAGALSVAGGVLSEDAVSADVDSDASAAGVFAAAGVGAGSGGTEADPDAVSTTPGSIARFAADEAGSSSHGANARAVVLSEAADVPATGAGTSTRGGVGVVFASFGIGADS